MPEKIIKQTLSEQIYNILKEDILSGRILMGDKLTNRELQERFQVSSTPVRDAINRLSKDGLTQEVSKHSLSPLIIPTPTNSMTSSHF